MKNYKVKLVSHSNSRGSVLVLVSFLLFVFIGIAALAIDIGLLSTTKNELQNAADAAALGATRKLGNIYQKMAEAGENLNHYNVDNVDGDKASIISVAKVVAFQNKAAKEDISIDETQGDIQIGVWNPVSSKFAETDGYPEEIDGFPDDLPNAVRVTVHRDDSNTSGQIATFFTGIFGINSVPVSAHAIAALSGQSTSDPGELELPIGVSRKWFNGPPSDWCGNIIKFSPPPKPTDPPSELDACAGWTGFDLGGATKNELDTILSQSNPDGTPYTTPGTSVGENFYYTGGTQVADVFTHLLIRYGLEGNDVGSVYQYDPLKNYDQQVIPTKVGYDEETGVTTNSMPICYYDNPLSNEDVLSECKTYVDPVTGAISTDAGADGVQLRYPNLDFENMDGGNQQKNFTGPLRNAHEWETTIVVYDSDDCQPTQDIPIKGYARVVLYNVGYPSAAYVYARVTCDFVSPEDTRGGGGYFGSFGSIPNLVE